MKSNFKGLTDSEVQISRQQYGSNILTPPKKESVWKLFFGKFRDPIIRILLIAVFLSLIVSFVHHDFAETLGIVFAILLATGVGFWFELDANKKFDLLNQVNDDTAVKVIRNGNICEITKKDVVVGDIVLLETGEEIPADGKLLGVVSLQVNESSLTGEPVISKTLIEADFDEHATYPSNRIYRGTTIVDGHCTMEVMEVGDATEFGKVARESAMKSGEETPLNKQLNSLSRVISIVGFSLGILTFFTLFIKDIFGGWIDTPSSWMSIETAGRILEYFMVAVTLIVVSVPEGLPMSVTLSLALSMRRMLKTNNLVRKMHACETMGAATVICTDKTGTLTQNRMQVAKTNFSALEDQVLQDNDFSRLIIENISANSTAYLDFTDSNKPKALGNPTEAALLFWLNKNNINYLDVRNSIRVVEQLTFSTERKYMATIVDSPALNKRILYVKGAPEIIFSKCKEVVTDAGIRKSSDLRSEIEQQLLQYQNQAMRTLGFAYKELEKTEARSIKELVESGMSFMGIVAISDPVREDVPDAVARCLRAGIDVKIVTGDTPGTAKEIGRQIGIWTESDTDFNIITGVEFEALSDDEALKRVRKLKIMCRARPTDKQRLVKLLQQCGEIVAVTGDGTNDAPALNFAHVGLSMGSGTSVAKEASDITLLDDSFNSIATAVMWGRSLYKNIQRFLLFQLTINLTALIVVFFGSLFGHELPLTVTQMLWVNLIMDTFAAGALASLPPDPKVMNEKPRKNTDFIIKRKIGKNIVFTGVFFVIFLSLILYYFNSTGIDIYKLSCFFTIFVLLQFWNMFNAKAFETGRSAFNDMKGNKSFLLVALLILAGQFLIVQFGGNAFRTVPISLKDWGIIIGGTSLVLWIGEISRFIYRKFSKSLV
ncbi:calcium-translocating P-type ATPase, PMCA-type [Bacteroidia bacterium]|nr:calcium-translocating P-type ATPase, PMCA-type [Bacteroidia bacterium]